MNLLISQHREMTMFSPLLRLNLLRWITLSHRSYCANVTSLKIESKTTEQPECVLHPLEEILNSVPSVAEALSPNDTIEILKKLSKISLNQMSSPEATPFKVIEHEKFKILRHAVRQSTSKFKTMDKFNILKASKILNIPADDGINNAIVGSLLDNVFNVSLGEILLFDEILTSKEQHQSNLIAQLRRHFINRFNMKISSGPIDYSYFGKTMRMLQFMIRNRSHICDQVYENMKNCLAKNNIDILTADEATSIIIILTNFQEKCEFFDNLKEKAFNVWQSTDVNIEMVLTTLSFLTKRNSSVIFKMYDDKRYLEKCVHVAIKTADVEKCFAVQNYFNYMGFANIQLIDFLLKQLEKKEVNENFVENCITIFIACDLADHKPPQFEEILSPHLESIDFRKYFTKITIDWAHFATQLSHYGIRNKSIVKRILKGRATSAFTEDGTTDIESLELERLIGAEIGDSFSNVKRIFGENVRSLVITEKGVIPLLFKIDTQTKNFVPFSDKEVTTLKSIRCNDDQCLVAILSDSFPDVNFLHPSLVTITLNALEWTQLLNNCQTKENFFNHIFGKTSTTGIVQ